MAVISIAPEITSLLVMVHQKSSLSTLIDNSDLIIYVDIFLPGANLAKVFSSWFLEKKKSYLVVNIGGHCF